jgi:transposase
MDAHKNARSCPASRALLYKRVSEQGWSVREASEAAGMSDRRGREWIRRASAGEALTDRSSRPHRSQRIDKQTHVRVVGLRRERHTIRQIAVALGISSSTVARVCRSAGLNRLRQLEPVAVPVRYDREPAGEMLHIDIKRL